MEHELSRLELLYGRSALERLAQAHVAVFGLGGVGGYVVEALTRSGVGALDLIDHDVVSVSNINRQIIATHSTIGMLKTEVAKSRILDINPGCRVRTFQTFFLPETAGEFDFHSYDYVVDAVDTVTAKLLLAQLAQATGVPLISAMGTGNKCHPEMLEVSDIYDTTVCPLARIMRKECRRRGIEHLKVVWSREEPLVPQMPDAASGDNAACESEQQESIYGKKRQTPGSTAFVPAAAGLLIAAEVVNDLTAKYR